MTKRPIGRPTDYTPELGQKMIDLMTEGYSLTAAAAALGHHRQRIYQWEKKHPEFEDAMNLARAKACLWWEDEARRLVKGGDGSAAVVIFGLKNRASAEWREKHELEHSGRVQFNVIDSFDAADDPE